MSVDDVARQLWGAPAPVLKPTDVAQVGSAPRMFDERMDRYVKQTIHSLAPLWLVLAIFLGAGEIITLASGVLYVPFFTLLFGGLAVWSFRKRGERRRAVRETLEHGDLVRPLITNIRCVEHRSRGRTIYVDYYVTFDLEGKIIEHHTRDPGISLLQVGVSEEVLWSARQPNVVVPTFMLM